MGGDGFRLPDSGHPDFQFLSTKQLLHHLP
jgi:hypothetical protein